MGRALTKFELNRQGILELLKSDEVRADLGRRAEAIAAAAGDGFEADTYIGRTRARGDVFTATPEAMKAEADHYALTRAIGAGRG